MAGLLSGRFYVKVKRAVLPPTADGTVVVCRKARAPGVTIP
jgi:hypothetical protein